MRALRAQVGLLIMVSSYAATQGAPATLRQVQVSHSKGAVQVEILLSAPVTPSIRVTTDPHRIVLEFAGTVSSKEKRIAVNSNGVRSVRYASHGGHPTNTRVIVDMDRTRRYDLQTHANHVTLSVGGSSAAGQQKWQRPMPVVEATAIPSHEQQPAPEKTAPQTKTLTAALGTSASSVSPAIATAPAAPPPAAGVIDLPFAAVVNSVPGSPETRGTNSVANSQEGSDAAVSAVDPTLKTVFRIKYVAQGVAYLDGGSSSGLSGGTKLEVKDTDLPVQQGNTADSSDPRVVAELEVVGLAETSAVTDIHAAKRALKKGDLAYLSCGDAQALVQQKTLSPTRQYPMVVTFTEGDPQDEEVRAQVPRPPLPSVNRTRGFIGVDHMGTISHGISSLTSSDIGVVLRADITRINGTYWNLSGYWRGRLTSQSTSQQTLQDLINRTYHLELTYENPNSRWVAGVGRLYLPWAPSLNTIDGGYFGARLSKTVTAGLFAGSTPDPTSWNFNPGQRIGGSFLNFQGGSYDDLFYSSTSGFGIFTLKGQIERPFVFFENSLSYKRYLSIYDSLQVDNPRGNQAVASPGLGLSRNFLTVRLQVHPRVEIDFNQNYFRDIPTFDPSLIGTGLLDKYLFQGFSVGARAEVAKQVFVYSDVGLSNRTGDAKSSWNQMVGVTFGRLPWFGLHADAHYSRFNSSFGDGSYESLAVSRDLSERLRLSVLAGSQNYSSSLAGINHSRFLNGNAEWSFGSHYFFQGGFTANRGGSFEYDQWLFTVGYRFDSKERHR